MFNFLTYADYTFFTQSGEHHSLLSKFCIFFSKHSVRIWHWRASIFFGSLLTRFIEKLARKGGGRRVIAVKYSGGNQTRGRLHKRTEPAVCICRRGLRNIRSYYMSELQGKYFAGRAVLHRTRDKTPALTKSGCKYCNKNRDTQHVTCRDRSWETSRRNHRYPSYERPIIRTRQTVLNC